MAHNYSISIFLLLILISCSDKKNYTSLKEHNHSKIKTESFYTCAMHPQIKETKKGKCPICHMNLTKVDMEMGENKNNNLTNLAPDVIWQCLNFPDVTSEKEDVCPIDGSPMVKKQQENKAGKIIAKVKLRKAQLTHFRPTFFPVTSMIMTKKIRLLGTVLQSEDKESKIPARIDGRVEKVFVQSTGSFIKVGDAVLELFSSNLITAGEEYLIAKKSFSNSKTKSHKELLNQSRKRLKLWGIKDFQINQWVINGKVPTSIKIYSASTGIVRKRNAVVGKYFKEGQNFFELSDLSEVWVEMDVYEHDSALISLGQKVKMEFTSLPGEVTEGRIDFINPILDTTSRTLKVRTTIQNKLGKLKPGMLADIALTISFDGEPLVVPRTAIIDTGKRKVVWVKNSDKEFQAKEVYTGHESEGYVEIKKGLIEGNQVVIDGNFLLDAQAQLFGGYENFHENSEEANEKVIKRN